MGAYSIILYSLIVPVKISEARGGLKKGQNHGTTICDGDWYAYSNNLNNLVLNVLKTLMLLKIDLFVNYLK